LDEKKIDTDDGTRRKIFIIVGVCAALVVVGFVYLLSRPAAQNVEVRLPGALRAGDPAFEQVREQVILDSKEAFESPRPLGDIVMTLESTARNFTNRTITGLEVRGAVVDSAGSPIRERTLIALPINQTTLTELEPNKTLPVRIMLEGFKKSDDRANFRMEVTAVRFK
jgi:hypothetical protein